MIDTSESFCSANFGNYVILLRFPLKVCNLARQSPPKPPTALSQCTTPISRVTLLISRYFFANFSRFSHVTTCHVCPPEGPAKKWSIFFSRYGTIGTIMCLRGTEHRHVQEAGLEIFPSAITKLHKYLCKWTTPLVTSYPLNGLKEREGCWKDQHKDIRSPPLSHSGKKPRGGALISLYGCKTSDETEWCQCLEFPVYVAHFHHSSVRKEGSRPFWLFLKLTQEAVTEMRHSWNVPCVGVLEKILR